MAVQRRFHDEDLFTTDLIKGSDTIAITNVQILAVANPGDNITADTAFTGLGEANAVFIYGTATWYFTHSANTDEDTTVVQFSVTIPLDSAPGTYTAQLTTKVTQSLPEPPTASPSRLGARRSPYRVSLILRFMNRVSDNDCPTLI